MKPWAGLALVAALAGCRTPGPPPLTMLPARACPEAPVLAGTRQLAEARPEQVDIAADAPCIATRAGPALYAAFQLPPRRPAMVEIAGVPQGETLFAPRAMLLDASGRVTREIGPDAFMFRPLGLSALVRLRPEDATLVVTSDPAAAGKRMSRIRTQVQTMVLSAPPMIYYAQDTGSDTRQELMLAHNGRVSVTFRLLAENP